MTGGPEVERGGLARGPPPRRPRPASARNGRARAPPPRPRPPLPATVPPALPPPPRSCPQPRARAQPASRCWSDASPNGLPLLLPTTKASRRSPSLWRQCYGRGRGRGARRCQGAASKTGNDCASCVVDATKSPSPSLVSLPLPLVLPARRDWWCKRDRTQRATPHRRRCSTRRSPRDTGRNHCCYRQVCGGDGNGDGGGGGAGRRRVSLMKGLRRMKASGYTVA